MCIVYSKNLWLLGINGITLYPFIILKDKYKNHYDSKRIINHEKIHIQQQKELLVIFFYIAYVLEWFVRLFMKGNAYKNISFEKEAYSNDDNLEYLKQRKIFNFIKYYG